MDGYRGLFDDRGVTLHIKVIALYAILATANLLAWAWAFAAFHGNTLLLGTALLAYGFGLRHAVDADHIAAIDNVTRKLMQEGKRPIGVGFFFALGHSTVVIIAVAVIAVTASTLQDRFPGLLAVGGVIGTTVSVGFLFGLGFGTATEIALLGISASEAAKGISVWSILVFPALFTAGMSLVDTTDGVLMLGAYGWAFVNPIRKLYYNLTITGVSVVVALAIGSIETLGLVADELGLDGGIWNVVNAANDNFVALFPHVLAFGTGDPRRCAGGGLSRQRDRAF